MSLRIHSTAALAAFVMLLMAPCLSSQEAQTVEKLVEICDQALMSDPDSHVPASLCFGAIAGASIVLSRNCESTQWGEGDSPIKFLRMGQMPTLAAGAQAFVNWARANPSR